MGEKNLKPELTETHRPEVFQYESAELFVKDMLDYLKSQGVSATHISKKSGIAKSYVSMIISGKRTFNLNTLYKLLPHLMLTYSEKNCLTNLVLFENASNHEEKTSALKKLNKIKSYKTHNPKTAEAYKYFSHWYNVVVREMATLPQFDAQNENLQNDFVQPPKLTEFKESLDFLLETGFLKKDKTGKFIHPQKVIDCTDRIYKTSLKEFYRQIYDVVIENIEDVPLERKKLLGHTVSLSADGFEKAKQLLEKTFNEIVTLGTKEAKPENVYHFNLLGMSLTKYKKAQ